MSRGAKKRIAGIVFWLALIPVIFMLLKMQSSFINDTDLFWHIELGKNILHTKSITHTDSLSWIAEEQNLPFINHSWASDILLYLFSKIHGYMLGAYLYGVITMLTLGICLYVFWANQFPVDEWARFRPSITDGAALVLISWAIYETRGNPRPQQISLIFFVIAYYLLEKTWKTQYQKSFFLLPALAVIWANFHGGTLPLLFVLTGMYLVLSLIPSYNGKIVHAKQGNPKQLACILVLEIAAGCINPYGPFLYWQLYRVSDTCSVINVSEWQPANINNAAWVFVSLAAFIAILIFSSWKFSLSQIMPVFLFAGITMVHVRAYPWYAISLAIFVMEHAKPMRIICHDIIRKRHNHSDYTSKQHTFLKGILLSLYGIGVFAGVWASAFIINQKYYREFSAELISTIQTISPQRMYTSYNSGGMAIAAGFQSFVDSRADAFTKEILSDASVLSGGASGIDIDRINGVLDKYQFDALLLARYDSSMILSYIEQQEDWTCVYSDVVYSLFVPTSDTAKFAAEYMTLNGQYNENKEAYTQAYPNLAVSIQYVTPSDIVSLIQNKTDSIVFFADAKDNESREVAGTIQNWAQKNGYSSVYVCNIKQYRMEYGYDNSGVLQITQNRSVGYDELLSELDPLLPYYEVQGNGINLQNTTLNVKTIPTPFVICIHREQVKTIDITQQ